MRGLVAAAIALLLAAGGVAVAIHDSPAPATTTAGPQFVPRPGQALVEGTGRSLSADNAEAAPLRPPLVITVANRGQGGATFTAVTVDNQMVAISWYAGQPLPLSGSGSLDIAGGPVTVDASGSTWSLDGPPRALTPGRYALGAPVAVGASGLATPRETVSFEAGPRSAVETMGGASVHLDPAPLHLEGPGRLKLEGEFALRTPSQSRNVSTITFGPGDYVVDLAPSVGGVRVKGILQGAMSAT